MNLEIRAAVAGEYVVSGYVRSIILITLAVGCLLSGCAAGPPRLQSSGLNTVFAGKNGMSFADYIKQTRTMMLRARVDIHDGNREMVLNANLPF